MRAYRDFDPFGFDPARTNEYGTPAGERTPGKQSLTGLIMRSADGAAGGDYERSIAAASGQTGRPLPRDLQGRLETALDADLSAVRVHTGSASAQAARDVGAKAYTLGNDIHFSDGRFRPGTSDGDRLIAHEVAHTVQQRGVSGGAQPALEVSVPGDTHEQEAERFADAFVAGGSAPVSAGAASGVSRALIQRVDEVNRDRAQRQLSSYNRTALNQIDADRAWLSGNWIEFYGYTQQNPRLAWTEGVVSGTISNALGNLLTELGEDLIRRAGRHTAASLGALIGTEVAPGVGTVIGFVIGVVVEQAASMIYEAITGGNSEGERAAHAAGRRTAQLIANREAALNEMAAQGRNQHLAVLESTQQRLTNATTQAEADRVGEWARQEEERARPVPPASDRSLFERMLRDWVREHAGDEEDADSRTAETDWESARTRAFGEGDSLDGHPELFAYQTRGHWASIGLTEGADRIAPIVRRADEIHRTGRFPGYADTARSEFDGRRFTFEHPNRTTQLFNFVSLGAGNQVARYGGLSSYAYDALDRGDIRLVCTLDLTTEDGTCFVDSWDYEVTFLGVFELCREPNWVSPGGSTLSWSESPD